MERAKVFANGGSQAVRLPKDCRFDADEVLVNRVGDVVILSPVDDAWASVLAAYDLFTDDFLADGIPQPPMQQREGL